MTDEQKSKVLDMLRSTMGRGFICTELKITLRQLKTAMREDMDFRDAIETVEANNRDMIDQVIVGDAMSGSVSSALAWRALQLRVEATAESRIVERRKLKAREAEVKAKVTAVETIVARPASVDLKGLDLAQLEAFRLLIDKSKSEQGLSDQDTLEYGRLMIKIQTGQSALSSPGSRDIRSLASIMDEDDE